MDRNTGFARNVRMVETTCRNGIDGVARQGVGGRFRDEICEGRSKAANPFVPGWGVREVQWRPSRKVDVMPVSGLVRGQQEFQKIKLTDRPPFVQRRGNIVLNPHAEGFPPSFSGPSVETSKVAERNRKRKERTLYLEDLRDRRSVRDL